TRFAAVDAGNLSLGPTQRMLRCLRRPAAGDEDGLVFFIRPSGPKQMIVRAASLRILPLPLIFFQAIDRWRIRVTVVELTNFFGYIDQWRELFYWLGHGKSRISIAGSAFTTIGANINTLKGNLRLF